MGEWKAQISLRVRQDLRHDLEEFAYKERRRLRNFGETLLKAAAHCEVRAVQGFDLAIGISVDASNSVRIVII